MSKERVVQTALVIPEIVEMILITLAFGDLLRMEGISQVDEPPTSIQGKSQSLEKPEKRGTKRTRSESHAGFNNCQGRVTRDEWLVMVLTKLEKLATTRRVGL